jgi:hypothetical protein
MFSASIGQEALDTLNAADRNPNSPFTRVFETRYAEAIKAVDARLR